MEEDIIVWLIAMIGHTQCQ